jgi:hypothetical protein
VDLILRSAQDDNEGSTVPIESSVAVK